MSSAKQAAGYILGNYGTISNATSNSISYGSSQRGTSDQISVSLGAGSTISG
ncbi:hypothetical protein [Neisseria weixii]|uniref:hypothetical protein n=1 Tax=Neisseria weixii TaxID=1853276 RepID=UPI001315AC5D|nr:hypothetical protein [Neisseria weixii]